VITVDFDGQDARAVQLEWVRWCAERVKLFPVVQERQRSNVAPLHPYHFMEILFNQLDADDIVACGDGAACVVSFQVAKIKAGQRLFTMPEAPRLGYDIPQRSRRGCKSRQRVVCLAGDGSGMLNIQELQTIVHHQLPVKIFILNNGGYISIRTTQNSHFGGNLVGEGPRSGVTFPDS